LELRTDEELLLEAGAVDADFARAVEQAVEQVRVDAREFLPVLARPGLAGRAAGRSSGTPRTRLRQGFGARRERGLGRYERARDRWRAAWRARAARRRRERREPAARATSASFGGALGATLARPDPGRSRRS